MKSKLSRWVHTVVLCSSYDTIMRHTAHKTKRDFLLQIKLWFSCEGEKQLVPLDSLVLSVDKIKEMRESLEHFLEESVVSSSSSSSNVL